MWVDGHGVTGTAEFTGAEEAGPGVDGSDAMMPKRDYVDPRRDILDPLPGTRESVQSPSGVAAYGQTRTLFGSTQCKRYWLA